MQEKRKLRTNYKLWVPFRDDERNRERTRQWNIFISCEVLCRSASKQNSTGLSVMETDTRSRYVRFGLTPTLTLVFGFAFGRGINWKRAYRAMLVRRGASTLILDLSETLSIPRTTLQIRRCRITCTHPPMSTHLFSAGTSTCREYRW